MLLGDTTTPAARATQQALEAAGQVTWVPDGGDLLDEALERAIGQRCFAPVEPAVDCDALVLVAHGPAGAARVDHLARAWQKGAGGPIGWRVRAVLTVDAGYLPPSGVIDGAWQRTGLADTTRWQVGMIQSRDDPRAGRCDADGCGVLPLAVAHGARSQPILSACPHAGPAGEHRATLDVPDWNAWQVAAVPALLRASRDPRAPPLVNACLADLDSQRPLPPRPPPVR